MRTLIFWALGLTTLFLVLFHYQATTDVINSVGGSVTNGISKLQGGN